MTSWSENLLATKSLYPFAAWHENLFPDMPQYSLQNCTAAQQVVDLLITKLIALGEHASDAQKLACFETAVLALNELNDQTDGALIETGEREQLCKLIDSVGLTVGLDPQQYGDGDGIASEWRDW
jgi:hypothetical protein